MPDGIRITDIQFALASNLHQIAEETKVFHPLQYYLYVPVVMHGSE
jgi:hypothetical protein